jgi:hypothetical protein
MKKAIKLYNAAVSATYEAQAVAPEIKIPTAWDLEFLGVLSDAISCEVSEERNGKYELEMVYPASGANSTKLVSDRIIEVDCPLRDSIGKNLFRIYRVERDLGGRVYVYARQISFDLSYYVATGSGIEGVPGGITVFADSGGAHSYGWNLRKISNAYLPFTFGGDAEYDTTITGAGFQQAWSSCTSIRSYLGGEELTGYDLNALQRFGGEYEFTNWAVNLWEERGVDTGVTITYGTNVADLMADDDLDGVYTSVCFFAIETDGISYTKYCSDVFDTSYASLFPYPRVKTVDYSADVLKRFPDGGATAEQITAMLNSAAQAYANAHNAEGNPVRKLEVDAVEAAITNVYLCDTLHVFYHRHGLDVDARMKITGYTWDVLMQRYNTITLGAIQTSLAKIIADNGSKADVLALQNVAASTQNAIQELQSRYVLKAGDTMTGRLTSNRPGTLGAATSQHAIDIRNNNIQLANTPSANTYDEGIWFQDSGGNGYASVRTWQQTDGTLWMQFYVRNRDSAGGSWPGTSNVLGLGMTTNGISSVSINQPRAWRPALFPANVATQTMNVTASTLGNLYRCTGTKYGGIYFQHLFGRFFVLSGRFFIASFVRSGANPGVYITMPSSMPVPLTTYNEAYGFRGENANEQVMFQFTANSRSVLVNTTESFTNAANGRLTFMFLAAVCYLR